MRDRPEGVTEAALVAALADGWGVRTRATEYVPLGAGSYHWSVTTDDDRALFVTVDDLGGSPETGFARLGRAFDTALALRRDAGLAFVVAPVPTRTGSTLWRLDSRYSLAVFPLLDGRSGRFGAHRPEDRAEIVGLLAALHAATPVVAAGAPPVDLNLPGRAGLHDALEHLDEEWTGGPYSEPARQLLAGRAGHVARLLADLDRLVDRVRATVTDWVVTHGEPHPGNVVRTAAGPLLVDWDTVRLAPPERDLWLLAADADDVLAGYTRATGRPVDPSALALYRLWWDLADIAGYVAELRGPHRGTEDTAASWKYLSNHLA
ncbi:phosphotransferase [Longispora sp. K20-0274]|uniref:phosphotransferase enzyme family protein n=1 Tax=Longispora sp. K20-0274 TaxID=3088255 RepID=UPI00399ACA3B